MYTTLYIFVLALALIGCTGPGPKPPSLSSTPLVPVTTTKQFRPAQLPLLPLPLMSLLTRNVTLAWIAEPNATGYRLWWATNTFAPPLTSIGVSNRDVGLLTTATISNLLIGQNYFFSVTAYNLFGESALAPELIWTNTPPPPLLVGLRWPNRGVNPVIFWTNKPSDSLEWSPDLNNWTNIPSSFYTIVPPECRVSISTNRWPARFFRVRR